MAIVASTTRISSPKMVNLIFSEDVLVSFPVSFLEKESNTLSFGFVQTGYPLVAKLV